MKKSKEQKISIVLFGLALVLFCISAVTGLTLELNIMADKICLCAGLSALSLGFVFSGKSIENNTGKEN